MPAIPICSVPKNDNQDHLTQLLSSILSPGWCYFIDPGEFAVFDVKLLLFELPSDEKDLFNHCFFMTKLVNFSIDTSNQSCWDEEISITITSAVGSGSDGNFGYEKSIYQKKISCLKPLLHKLTNFPEKSPKSTPENYQESVKVEIGVDFLWQSGLSEASNALLPKIENSGDYDKEDSTPTIDSLGEHHEVNQDENNSTVQVAHSSHVQNRNEIEEEGSDVNYPDKLDAKEVIRRGIHKLPLAELPIQKVDEIEDAADEMDHDNQTNNEMVTNDNFIKNEDETEDFLIEDSSPKTNPSNIQDDSVPDKAAKVRARRVRISSSKRSRCKKCFLTFVNEGAMNCHMRMKHFKKEMKCRHCPEKCKNDFYLSIHMRRRHSDIMAKEGNVYDCGDCSLTFTGRYALRQHRLKIHELLETKCDVCGKIYENKEKFQMHFYQMHGRGKEKRIAARKGPITIPYGCSECSKIFRSERELRYHNGRVHAVEHAKCEQCEKTYKNRFCLKRHIRNMHEGGRDKPRVKEKIVYGIFQCEKCSRVFDNKTSLRLHRNSAVHSEKNRMARQAQVNVSVPESEKTCSLCQKVFLHKDSLRKHKKYAHSNSADIVCSVCSLSFNCRTKLHAHMMQHTGELDCPYCDKTFKWKHTLTSHIRAHEGLRPYKCTFCPSDFIDNRALKKHTLKVHGEETKGGISKDLNLRIIRTAHRKKIDL